MRHTELIAQMTLPEKCALLSGKDVWHTRAIERLGIPSIMLSDGPSGLRKQEGEGDQLGLHASVKATCFPSAAAIANSWDTELAERVGSAIGEEARAQNVQVLLGPGLNIKRSPLCGRNFEYFSEDPYLSGKLAAGFIRGVQRQGVSACPKHFAANSQEGHRMASDSVVDERTLRELYLTNFEIAIQEGQPQALMTAYNKINGTYANEHPHLLHDILRGEWGYQGAVITDWGGSNDFTEGIRMGSNLEMPGCGDDSPVQLLRAVREGRIPEETVNERVDELLELILSTDMARKPGTLDVQGHHETALEAATEAIVLLKNEGGLLPLTQRCKVAVIGDFAQNPRYQGAGSSMVNPTRVDSTLTLLEKYFPSSIGYAPGFLRENKPDAALTEDALKLAREAECVLLYLGLTEVFESEGIDRAHMRIPQNQIDLLDKLAKVNKHIIVVLSSGSAVEMPWLDQCQALVYGSLGGQAGAEAMLRVLSGRVCPSGKLAETFPVAYRDLPVSHYYPGEQKTSEYREALFVGYRYCVTADEHPLFPFGYGLSYTSFTYANAAADEVAVSLDVTNTGSRAGVEIVQLYVALPESRVFRPDRELKGFARVMLAPGETKRVTIPLDDKTFRYFNVKTNRWEVEGGIYQLMLGASSEDIRLTTSIAIAGTNAPQPYGDETDCYDRAQVHAVTDSIFRALLGHEPPPRSWDEKAPLEMNDAIMQLYYAKNPLARWVGKLLNSLIDRSLAKGTPDLNLLFMYNMPFRGIAKMMNGMVSMEMVEDILLMANGHFFKGLGGVIHGFFHRPHLPSTMDS